MPLLVWTQKPDSKSMRRAARNAAVGGFLDRHHNEKLILEIKAFLEQVKDYLSSASAEAVVNLVHGLPWKVVAFKRQLKRDLKRASSRGETVDLYNYLLGALGTKADIRQIPSDTADVLAANGPCMLVSNHSYPPFDGLTTLSLMQRYRSQIGIMVNSNNCLLRTFPEYCCNTIPLHMEGGLLGCRDKDEVRRSQIAALKRTIRELNDNGCVTVFPAGQGSKATRWGDPITDLPWLSGVGQIVSHFNRQGRHLDIVPVHIVGHMGSTENSRRYQWAAIERPTWLPAALQLALFNPPPKVSIRVGHPISAASLSGKSRDQITDALRQAVYDLGDDPAIAKRTE